MQKSREEAKPNFMANGYFKAQDANRSQVLGRKHIEE
jgi:hypothetical protein